MKETDRPDSRDISRRGFLQSVGATAAGVSLVSRSMVLAAAAAPAPAWVASRPPATAMGAFLYPPTRSLDEAGYYSWPGSSFDAEGHHKRYAERIQSMEGKLGMRLAMQDKALDTEADVTAFVEEIKKAQPDGLLLIPFKKGHFSHVVRIIEETQLPTVVLATLGVLLVDQIKQVHRRAGVYLISALEDFEGLEEGLRMLQAGRRMKDSLLISITAEEPSESVTPRLGTRVRVTPHQRFYDAYARTEATEAVKELAHAYWSRAREAVEPKQEDVLDAARCYFALKGIIEEEQADAMMMDCLPGLAMPHKHVPPCMAFMSLRDEGIPAGCQADLNATLTLMLVQCLFGRPGFQQNAAMNTAENRYFGAHCTSPSKMCGPEGPAEPYILRSHAEAGWGCVPRVLFSKGQQATMASYLSGEKPQMLVYTGEIVGCPENPPAGGCRTNLEMTINEVADVCDVKGMHQVVFYGNCGRELRAFCQLYGIEVVT